MKSDLLYLGHIVKAIADAEQYATCDRGEFLHDRMRQDAVIRKLEIIGEAVKNLSDATKGLAPEIPWRLISGMRDRLIHAYFRVDLDLVWAVVHDELPRLRKATERIDLLVAPSENTP